MCEQNICYIRKWGEKMFVRCRMISESIVNVNESVNVIDNECDFCNEDTTIGMLNAIRKLL